MAEVVTYSPHNTTLVIGGHVLSDFESINVTRQFPVFRRVAGIKGKNARVSLKNTAADVDIEVSQTSETNKILGDIISIDEQYGTVRLELTLVDPLGVEVFSSIEGYLDSIPDFEYKKDISIRRWRISCNSSTHQYNGKLASVQDMIERAGNFIDDLF